MSKPFFAGAQLSDYLAQRRLSMEREIDQMDGDTILSAAPETLASSIAARYNVSPIAIDDAGKKVDVGEARIDARLLPDRVAFNRDRPVWIDATTTTLTVAFSGNRDLLRLQPGTWDGSNPDGTVAGTDLVFERAWPGTPSQAEVERWVRETMRELTKNVEWQEPDLRSHNQSLERTALQAIAKRRTSLLAKRHLQASLPFNITARADAPLTFAPEGLRRKPSWLPPTNAGSTPFQPEASLSAEQYEDILRISRAIGHSLERTPNAFSNLTEEELRSVFLAALNAQFEGGATGETFNAGGKTDILIRYQDRNLFIGECKVWQGDVGLTKAVDQILGYLCWRDSHAAILPFVRNKEMSSVVAKIPSIVAAHANYIRSLRIVGDSEWQYKFTQKGDSARELTLAIQAYHIRI